MSHVLNAESMRTFVRRVSLKLPNGPVRARFARLAFGQLLSDARNFELATSDELEGAPDWARSAQARGEIIVWFKLDRSAGANLHGAARRLAAACALADADPSAQTHLKHPIAEARRLIAKIGHANFEIIEAKARRLARAQQMIATGEDLQPQCEDQMLAATCRRTWRRITSVAALHAVGREFGNCLARPPHKHYHAARLRAGSHQYWVLRDFEGGGLVVAMADAPRASHFIEVRAPRNAVARGHSADLERLAVALGMHTPPPPPMPTALLTAPRLRRGLCLCCLGLVPPLPHAARAL